MKRFLLLSLLTMLTVGISHQALGSATDYNSIFYDAILTDHTDFQDTAYDMNQYAITADIPLDNFKLGFDCTYSLLDYDSFTEYEGYAYKIKAGYALYNNDHTRIDLTVGYYNNQFQSEDGPNDLKITYESMIAGLDAKLLISDVVWLNANYVRGINPCVSSSNTSSQDLDQLSIANVRLNFQILDDTGLSIGYCWETLKTAPNSYSEFDIKNKGFTAGISYIF